MVNEIDFEWYDYINNLENNNNRNIYNLSNNQDSNIQDSNNDEINTNLYHENDSENDNNVDIKQYNTVNYIPKCSDIYISTKTKILYLNKPIDLKDLFWKIPIIEYHKQNEGIIKKQIKIQSFKKEDLIILDDMLNKYYYYKIHIIKSNDNSNKKIAFQDTRKISIGINKKDINSTR